MAVAQQRELSGWWVMSDYCAFSGIVFGLVGKAHLSTPVCPSPQDAKFVEERRKQLQNYLRHVMNKVIQVVPEFAARPKKETLVQLVPFFV